MKKIIPLILILLSFLFQQVKADFMPSYTNSVNHYGIGAAKITNFVTIYEKPDINSKILQKIYWNNIGNLLFENKENTEKFSDVFLTFLPQDNIVLLSVEDENDEWIEVCYNQKLKLFGWIKKENKNSYAKFYSYRDLLLEYGKKYGIYIYRNLPYEYKKLYSGPNKEAREIDEFKYAKYISPWLVQGNWVLVKVTTYDNKTKTGWFRWRDNDGRLYCFVNLK